MNGFPSWSTELDFPHLDIRAFHAEKESVLLVPEEIKEAPKVGPASTSLSGAAPSSGWDRKWSLAALPLTQPWNLYSNSTSLHWCFLGRRLSHFSGKTDLWGSRNPTARERNACVTQSQRAWMAERTETPFSRSFLFSAEPPSQCPQIPKGFFFLISHFGTK